jgi:hypothetical protein
MLPARMLLLCSAACAPVEAGVTVLVDLLLSDVHGVIHRGGGSTAVRNDAVAAVVGSTRGW